MTNKTLHFKDYVKRVPINNIDSSLLSFKLKAAKICNLSFFSLFLMIDDACIVKPKSDEN